ncbi:hypothetical protein RBSH_06116 [Rhodopirellula baltica SH28]|uniref:Uncharacterized protein n=1 Tax=Rhodopirellula baltica SH28 TaxID=993517 RepID=K5DYP2_RHOBT|nr:hypothetical protein RBSH_06116 [Rhodopirellula baltica SH28]
MGRNQGIFSRLGKEAALNPPLFRSDGWSRGIRTYPISKPSCKQAGSSSGANHFIKLQQ